MAPKTDTRRLAIALWLSAVWVLLSCAPALAHATLVGASPPAGSETSTPPGRVELRFNEPVDAEFDPLVVRDARGDRVDEGDARVDPEDARVVLADLERLPEGSYTVEWRVTSIDGHVIEGRYGFAVTAAGENQPPGDARGAAGAGAEERGQADREPAAQDGGTGASAPILAYSALSLGVVAGVVAAALSLARLARRPKP